MHNCKTTKNIKRKFSHWSKEEDEILKKYYTQLGTKGVMKYLPNRNAQSIYDRARKLNIKCKSHFIINKNNKKYNKYNEDYFETIDTPDKAYWLGFIYADGYITTSNRWGIELQYNDISHLQLLNKCLNSNVEIKSRLKKSPSGSINKVAYILISNKKMYLDLLKNGVIKNKTYTLEFPKENIIPDSLMNHFIRGLFDGDGSYTCIKCDKHTNMQINFICKSEKFIDDLQTKIKEKGIIMNKSYIKRDDIYTIYISNKLNALKFIDYIYHNHNNICLKRKLLTVNKIKIYAGHNRNIMSGIR